MCISISPSNVVHTTSLSLFLPNPHNRNPMRQNDAAYVKGRFSDAHAAAEEARKLEPFGKAVRRRCPRLMALHSEDARSQASELVNAVRNGRFNSCSGSIKIMYIVRDNVV